MRLLLTLLPLVLLGGCSLWMPRHDPDQAWVTLAPEADTHLHALEVDDAALDDHRFFQVSPGSHTLGVLYRFQVAPENVGGAAGPLERECLLVVEFPEFKAGDRYRLEAGGHGFRPWAKLYDQHDFLLARGSEQGCGDNLASR
ncbi:hypothetical protein JQR85_19065 [Stutzerimonas urumqiensis]|uniref:PA0061/PA0062 family lipoprotein n=1 Tax=Stutzerimonas urumqiensis TaxID=638269 RepID=UPI000EB3340C|nr:hypothetical protein [Stutzerimonas urumqiensis]